MISSSRDDSAAIEFIKKTVNAQEIDLNPILSYLTGVRNYREIKSNFSPDEIKESYRGLSKMFHPDSPFVKIPRGMEKIYGDAFHLVHVVYNDFEDSNKILNRNIPHKISSDYSEASRSDVIVLKNYFLYDWAHLLEIKKVPREKFDARKIYLFDEVIGQADVDDYITRAGNNELNPDLDESEWMLEYGFVEDFSEGIPGPCHWVALKHLINATNRFSHEIPENEWLVVDKMLGRYFREIEGVWNFEAEKYDIRPRTEEVAFIQPSTLVMRKEYNGKDLFFVCAYPFHKHLWPREEFLIPINQLASSKGNEIALVDNSNLPVTVDDMALKQAIGRSDSSHVPWVCLNQDDIAKIRDVYPAKNLPTDRILIE